MCRCVSAHAQACLRCQSGSGERGGSSERSTTGAAAAAAPITIYHTTPPTTAQMNPQPPSRCVCPICDSPFRPPSRPCRTPFRSPHHPQRGNAPEELDEERARLDLGLGHHGCCGRAVACLFVWVGWVVCFYVRSGRGRTHTQQRHSIGGRQARRALID